MTGLQRKLYPEFKRWVTQLDNEPSWDKTGLFLPQMVEKGRPTVVRDNPWREMRIQVDVPVMDASFHH
jgi:hypothetical protein